MDAATIKKRIETQLPGAMVVVEGEDGRHFSATVTAAEFAGKTKVQQQQLIYNILGAEITSGAIHALSLKTLLPENKNSHE
jgi:acid stress-induced BolA-like protein IbaG/YrbA